MMGRRERVRALIVGLGGLGCPASLALAKAGVGHLTLVDPDRVEPTNLHRQPWFQNSDVGALKVEAAAARLQRSFPRVRLEIVARSVGPENVDALLREHSVAIDGTDGIEAKFALSDAAIRTAIPLAYGGVVQMVGQAMLISREGPCLRCLFEGPPPAEAVPSCAGAGVLGSLAGVTGALQALLGLSAIEGRALPGRLFVLNGMTMNQRVVAIHKRADCECAQLAGKTDRPMEARWIA
jgi:adenylyltransferase/sulfurtransferase